MSAAPRDTIRFLMDGQVRELRGVDPTTTVLNWLRYQAKRPGTKEGCAEGDCGACTVALGTLDGDTVRYDAVNACIQFLPSLDGKELVTVESLARDGELHPVQRAMVEHHGSQCGFCTPGFVMSLFAMHEKADPTETPVPDVLAGNLCRCTGYGPILEAAGG
jgi:xanthine dehydrogenase small subunit